MTHAFQLAKSKDVLVQSCLQVSKANAESGHGLQLTVRALPDIMRYTGSLASQMLRKFWEEFLPITCELACKLFAEAQQRSAKEQISSMRLYTCII